MEQLQLIRNKIFTIGTIKSPLNVWRFKDKKIVFTNGCFDILHPGHIDYLSKAKDLGDVLIVGINSDDSVRRLNKGVTRPLQDEISRATIIASLHFVDAVIIFNEDTPLDLITYIRPDVLVKGADYTIENVVGADLVQTNGGEVKLIPFLDGYSTSAIEKKIRNS